MVVQPTQAQPTQAQPTWVWTTQAQPPQVQPTRAQLTLTHPTQAQPTQAKPTWTQSTQAQSTQTQPAQVPATRPFTMADCGELFPMTNLEDGLEYNNDFPGFPEPKQEDNFIPIREDQLSFRAPIMGPPQDVAPPYAPLPQPGYHLLEEDNLLP